MLYSCIFIYMILFDKLKFFLAPTMYIYIKLSIIPLILIGLVMIFNNKVEYKFKISDLILLLPLIFLITSQDGRLTSSFASKRVANVNRKSTVIKEKSDNKEKIENKEYDFNNPYFDIVDSNYNELSSYITFAPKADKYLGKTIKVKGVALKQSPYIPQGFFQIGKYIISCCAADAEYAGFYIKYDPSKVEADKWYEIKGILEKGKDKEGYDIIYINAIEVDEIKEEEQFIYPCYYYDNGKCESLSKYELEY